MNAHIIPESRTWDSGETLGEARNKRLAAYDVQREPEDLEKIPAKEFDRIIERARSDWHINEAKRVAVRLGSTSTAIEQIAPSLETIP